MKALFLVVLFVLGVISAADPEREGYWRRLIAYGCLSAALLGAIAAPRSMTCNRAHTHCTTRIDP